MRADREIERFIPGRWTKTLIAAHQRGKQTVRMAALHVTLHALWAEHAAIERKLFPRFKTDDLVFADLQLDPALLSAEAAVCLYQLLGGMDRFVLPPTGRHVIQVRPELFFENLFGDRSLSHSLPLSVSTAPEKVICACRPGTVPANFPLGQPSRS